MAESTSTKRNLIRHDWSAEDYKEYRRKSARECQKKRRTMAREQGLCLMCCKRKPMVGYSCCDKCYGRVLAWKGRQNERTKNS